MAPKVFLVGSTFIDYYFGNIDLDYCNTFLFDFIEASADLNNYSHFYNSYENIFLNFLLFFKLILILHTN